MKEIKVYEADEVDRKLTRFIKLVRSAYKEGYREASRGDKTRSAG